MTIFYKNIRFDRVNLTTLLLKPNPLADLSPPLDKFHAPPKVKSWIRHRETNNYYMIVLVILISVKNVNINIMLFFS